MHFRTSQMTRIRLKLVAYSFHNVIFFVSFCLRIAIGRRRGTEPVFMFDSRAEATTLHYITLHYRHLADTLIQSDVH